MPVTRLSMKRKEREERKKKRCKELIVKIDDITTKIRELTDEASTLIEEGSVPFPLGMVWTYVNSIHTSAEGLCMALNEDHMRRIRTMLHTASACVCLHTRIFRRIMLVPMRTYACLLNP